MKKRRGPDCPQCQLPSVAAHRGAVPPAYARSAAASAIIAVVASDGVEVTQAIQNMAHTVPLVARKRTVARIYLNTTATAPMLVEGLLKVRRLAPRGPWHFVRSLGPAHVDPADNGQQRVKREQLSKSLDFLVPDALCAAGKVEVSLALVWQTPLMTFLVPPFDAARSVTFVDTPPLRVRILGIRYQSSSPAGTFEPSPLDYTLIQSWLGRAYPVAQTVWSQVTVNGPQSWPFDAAATNAFVRGIRMSDVSGGVDARTHYFGLVSDANGANFMRGLASGIPTTADPSTVASGPTGSNTWGWDTDGSYGDWYTGHELGHTFGRFHAEFCGAAGGAPYPFANGQLSNADGAFVGFDTGDPAHGLPMQALPGTTWHDVMTYCASQWLSSFTSTGIRDRLIQEDALPAGAMPLGTGRGKRAVKTSSGAGAVHIVGTLNLTHASGVLRHVTPYASAPAGTSLLAQVTSSARSRPMSGSKAIIRLYRRNARTPQEFAPPFIQDACTNPGDDVTGSIDVLIPSATDAVRLDLVLDGHVVDTFEPGAAPSAVRNIRRVTPRAKVRGLAASGSVGAEDSAMLTWQAPKAASVRGLARGSGAAPSLTYTVHVSADDRRTWHTAGFGLRSPQVAIDRRLFGETGTVTVRITATNGFSSATTEKSMKVADL